MLSNRKSMRHRLPILTMVIYEQTRISQRLRQAARPIQHPEDGSAYRHAPQHAGQVVQAEPSNV